MAKELREMVKVGSDERGIVKEMPEKAFVEGLSLWVSHTEEHREGMLSIQLITNDLAV